MSSTRWRTVILAAATLCHAAGAPVSAQEAGSHLVRSDSLPRMLVRIAPEFAYLGEITFPVDTVAAARQVVYGIADSGRLVRAVIVHFEHFLPEQDRQFVYPRLRMAELGGEEYLHQTWAFADFALFRQPQMQELLTRHRLTAGPRWVTDRYVRALPENPRYEVIIFYLESDVVSHPDITYGGLPVAPPPPPAPPPAVEAEIIARARAAFEVIPWVPATR